MADSDSDGGDRRVRTYALITGLPAGGVDEKILRQTLRAQTVGMMRCLAIPAYPRHALALFESREAALDAAEPGKIHLAVAPSAPGAVDESSGNNNNDGDVADPSGVVTLTVLPIQSEKAAAPELTFRDSIVVEGETVAKSALATTTGLMAVLKSFQGYRESVALEKGPGSVPRWCKSTAKGEDCPFGVQCWYLHRASCQVTVTGRGRGADADAAGAAAAAMRIRPRSDADAGGGVGGGTGDAAAAAAAAAVTPAAVAAMAAVPDSWRGEGRRVALPSGDRLVASLFGTSDTAATEEALQAAMDDLASKATAPLFLDDGATNRGHGAAPPLFFVKVDAPHGSPSDCMDWRDGAYDGGASLPAALKRDVTMHSALRASHDSLAVADAAQAMALLRRSRKVRAVVERLAGTAAATAAVEGDAPDAPPRLHPLVGAVSLRVEFFDRSLWAPPSQFQILCRGRKFCGAAQRVSWIIVDVVNRRAAPGAGAAPPAAIATAADAAGAAGPLLTEQLGPVNDWRQASSALVKQVLDELISRLPPATGAGKGAVCYNVACPAQMPPLAFGAPRILSVHDGDSALGTSNLLPFAGGAAAQQHRVVWRIRPPFPEQVPAAVQRLLERR